MSIVYLDHNATTPIDPRVADAMRPFLEDRFGNPSSAHRLGVEARRAVETARRQVADLLGCEPDEVVFTSGGSESNNLAILGAARAARARGRHLVTSSIEHPAVSEVCRALEREGFEISWLPVDRDGLVDPASLERAMRRDTLLVSVMHANNEVGTIQPVADLAAIARSRGALFHTDAAQSVGKIEARVTALGVDLLSVAGHKLYAPKGVGALYVRRGVRLEKLIHGADHERDLRAGTENVLLIVGLGMACRIATEEARTRAAHLASMRDRLYEGLVGTLGALPRHGHRERVLPNTLSVAFPGVEAATLLAEVEDVAASAGAACHADSVTVSPVLVAMGVDESTARATVRFSTGSTTTADEIDRAVDRIAGAVRRLGFAGRAPSSSSTPAGEVSLTHLTRGLGCACKLPPDLLAEVLRGLPAVDRPEVIVGTDGSDDAAVWRIDPERALVQSIDFLTPVVDDPEEFGAVAASNALSDIYAMGGTPRFALAVAAFPAARLPIEALRAMMRGAGAVAAEVGIPILGGHTIDDPEPKFGLVVTGDVHPARVWTNRGARTGDALVLTKPIGTGVLSTALKRGVLSDAGARELLRSMRATNRTAADVASRFEVHACTDVTGFGLLGHLLEVAKASKVDVDLSANAVPALPESLDHAGSGEVPGGTTRNLAWVSVSTTFDDAVPGARRTLLADAQTSGGLLLCVPMSVGEELVEALRASGCRDATRIGTVAGTGTGRIRVAP